VYSCRRNDLSHPHRRPRMSAYTFRSSRPDHWVSPRPTRDPARGRAIHGPLQPMQPRGGFVARLLGLG